MLRLYDFDDIKFERPVAELENADNVKITREINGAYEMEFVYPCDEKGRIIEINKIVVCEGQAFRIMKITNGSQDGNVLHIETMHVYNADSAAIHIQNIPDCIGKQPSQIAELAFAGTHFHLLSDEEITERGMTSIDAGGFLIDFFSADKLTPFEIMNMIIENCGKGEMYIDNYNIALVERIGNDTAVRLTLAENMENISIEKDINSLLTRLYPYGYEDVHIGSVNNNRQYIDSPNISKYGLKEGYRNYSDYKNPEDVMNRAFWEFDSRNDERIDVPAINISGNMIDMSKLADYEFMKLNTGDRVQIHYEGDIYYERIIKMEKYPYEPLMGSVSVGRVKKDLFFYLNQIGEIGKNYKRVSTPGGKVAASSISGIVNADGVAVKGSDGTVSILTDMISMADGIGLRFRCGISSGKFVFDLYSGSTRAIYADESGVHIDAADIKIDGKAVTADEEEGKE